MITDEFDAQLARAARSLVAEEIPDGLVRDAARLRPVGSHVASRALVLAGAFVLAAAVLGGTRLMGAATTSRGPSATAYDDAQAQAIPAVTTSDGRVSVLRNGDAIELVLERDSRTPLILASLVEPLPASNSSFQSVHLVDCPAATGLAQPYYVFGQSTSSGRVVMSSVTGTASAGHGLYLIVITSSPTAGWSFRIGGADGGGGGGAYASSFSELLNSGTRSAAGCFFNPR
jgi:hypothetical protein